MDLLLLIVVVQLCVISTYGWPGMGRSGHNYHNHKYLNENNDIKYTNIDDGDAVIGPPCTVKAHNYYKDIKCPTMPQPPPPSGSTPIPNLHIYPNAFIMQWNMFFVQDNDDKPPYLPIPSSPFNVTTGRTFYQVVNSTVRNMREQYDTYCIPVFGDPSSPMGQRNDFSCDFINVGITNTSYVVLHNDRPKGAPECCIIGKPFHPPPPDFAKNMPVQYRHTIGINSTEPSIVDTYCVYDKDAGPFCYSFSAENGTPHSFYMKGIPWIANWMWQPFYEFQLEVPPSDTWNLPKACDTAKYCPGWAPWSIDN